MKISEINISLENNFRKLNNIKQYIHVGSIILIRVELHYRQKKG